MEKFETYFADGKIEKSIHNKIPCLNNIYIEAFM